MGAQSKERLVVALRYYSDTHALLLTLDAAAVRSVMFHATQHPAWDGARDLLHAMAEFCAYGVFGAVNE